MFFHWFFMCWGIVGGANLQDYCTSRPLGTPCRTSCERSPHCGFSHDRFIPLTNDERDELINRHNQLRREVTLGEHLNHNIPVIPLMSVISYDRELEFLAACWILQCNFTAEDGTHRRTLLGRPYNQLLYRYVTPRAELYPPGFLTNGVDFWFGEWRHLSAAALSNNATQLNGSYLHYTPAKRIAHLSQLLWPDTRFIGCAKMHHRHQRRNNRLVLDHGYNLVCNYEPPLHSEHTAARRRIAEECRLLHDRHLCGESRAPAEDIYSAPINFAASAASVHLVLPSHLLAFVIVIVSQRHLVTSGAITPR